jgi:hypothetical protein
VKGNGAHTCYDVVDDRHEKCFTLGTSRARENFNFIRIFLNIRTNYNSLRPMLFVDVCRPAKSTSLEFLYRIRTVRLHDSVLMCCITYYDTQPKEILHAH